VVSFCSAAAHDDVPSVVVWFDGTAPDAVNVAAPAAPVKAKDSDPGSPTVCGAVGPSEHPATTTRQTTRRIFCTGIL
jgi:hypothetical protein